MRQLLYIADIASQVFNNAADFSRQDESSAVSHVETDADESRESNLSTQNSPTNGSSQPTETTRNKEVLNYGADSFNSLYLDSQLEGGIPDKVKYGHCCLSPYLVVLWIHEQTAHP